MTGGVEQLGIDAKPNGKTVNITHCSWAAKLSLYKMLAGAIRTIEQMARGGWKHNIHKFQCLRVKKMQIFNKKKRLLLPAPPPVPQSPGHAVPDSIAVGGGVLGVGDFIWGESTPAAPGANEPGEEGGGVSSSFCLDGPTTAENGPNFRSRS